MTSAFFRNGQSPLGTAPPLFQLKSSLPSRRPHASPFLSRSARRDPSPHRLQFLLLQSHAEARQREARHPRAARQRQQERSGKDQGTTSDHHGSLSAAHRLSRGRP